MVEVFKTNVQNQTQAGIILSMFENDFSDTKINFDLDDCDKILRVEGMNALYSQIIVNNLGKLGFKYEVLNSKKNSSLPFYQYDLSYNKHISNIY